MSWGTGFRGWPLVDTLDPGELNNIIPYLSFWIPAGAFTAGYNNPGIWHPIHIAAQEQSVDAWECPFGQQSEMFCIISMKNWPVNWAAPAWRVSPVWLQFDDAAAPVPTEFVNWTSAFLNCIMGGSLDRSNNPFEYPILSPALDAWEVSGGDAASLEKAISIVQVNGDAGSASGRNTILIEIERHSGGTWPQDTFGNSAYLLGIEVQYKTNFYNIAQWPV